MKRRCEWAGDSDPLILAYHDEEWGVPVARRPAAVRVLTLEGAQAGLSWATILQQARGLPRGVRSVRPGTVARFDRRKVERLLDDPGIVRNRLKVESTVNNARRLLEVQEEFGSFDAYIWQFVAATRSTDRWRKLARRAGARPPSRRR